MGILRDLAVAGGTAADRAALMSRLSPEGRWAVGDLSLLAFAVYPLDHEHPPSPAFARLVLQQAADFVGEADAAGLEELPGLARRQVEAYRELAVLLAEPYYGTSFDAVLAG